MSRKEYLLVALVIVLGGLYLAFFGDWFTRKQLPLEHSTRRVLASRDTGGADTTVTLALHGNYRLKSVEVVPAAEFQTNKYAHRLWHLVSTNGSAPTDGFAYGFPIAGMTPAFRGAAPEPLKPGVQYRLLVQTTRLKGEHDFSMPGAAVAQE